MKQVKFAALFMGKDFSSKEHHVSFENAYNDNHFYGVGDLDEAYALAQALLKDGYECIELIHSCISEDDGLLGRIGGDEFALLLPAPDYEWAEKKAFTLNETLDTDCISGDICWHMSASIGYCFAPKDGTSFHELYRKADAALYMSKHKGKGTNSMFY